MSENKAKEKNKDLLLDIYGGKSFLKIYQALGIGKIKFSFAEKGKEKEGIDCYMNADDFVSDFITRIKNRDFLKRAEVERQRAKAANDQFCKPIWTSRAGLVSGSSTILRAFSLQPGSATEFVFRATEAKKSIIVGFDYRELLLLEYRWRFLENDWDNIMAKKYCLANMRDENRESYYSSQVKEQEEQAQAADPAPSTNTQTEPPKNTAPASQPGNQTAEPKEKPRYMATGSGKKEDNPGNKDSSGKTKDSVPPTLNFRMKITTAVARASSGNAYLKAVTEDGTEYVLLFQKPMMERIPNWTEYEKKFSSVGTIISFSGKIYGDRISVEKIA